MIRRTDGPRNTQTWRTFIQNHAREVWACDFVTQHTAFFAVAYVFVIMEVSDRWLYSTLSIKGLPIPYAAPNASPFVERFMRTLRYEALDHFIFLSVDHVRRVVTEPIQYHNGAWPSKGDKRQPWSIRGAR